MGNEPYYIDKISGYIEEHLLTEEEKGFNQAVLYGRDITINAIVAHAKRYPMMADRQVLIIKEAQELSRTIENLATYAAHPQPTTVLVLCYKYKTIDKRKKLYKAVTGNGVLYESKKQYENQVTEWIRHTLQANGYSITYKAAQMLVEFLGTSLSKVHNELEKLQLILPPESEITPEIIEKNIGISKDYNNFELKKAIGEKNMAKASRIVSYFARNPKENPLAVTLSILHSFFSQIMQYHSMQDHNPKNVAAKLKINPYFVSEYQTAARYYPMKAVSKILTHLRNADVKSKGIGANALPQGELLKELLMKIMA